jgi:hypothetical protein
MPSKTSGTRPALGMNIFGWQIIEATSSTGSRRPASFPSSALAKRDGSRWVNRPIESLATTRSRDHALRWRSSGR